MPNNPSPLALHQIDGLARALLPMFDGTRPMWPSDKENIETLVRAIPGLVREILDLTVDVEHANDAVLTTEEAAMAVGLSAQTLNRLRHEGDGPPYIKHARRVVYRRSDLEAWMQSRRRVPEKGAGVAIRREIVITPGFRQDCVDAGIGEAVLEALKSETLAQDPEA